jgi:SPP1 gp7 family putative phage head morphogenesis protein
VDSVELTPIRETTEDYDALRAHIAQLFRKEIYLPLIRELGFPKKKLENAIYDLLAAVRAGRVRFEKGQFKGAFNSQISKELRELGAEWDRTHGSWKVPLSRLTADIRQAVAISEEKFRVVAASLDRRLSELLPLEIAEKFKAEKFLDSALYKVDSRFKKQIEKITVAPTLTVEARTKIAEQYTNNLRLHIKDWTEQEIVKLRQRVQKEAMAGGRHDALAKHIQRSYGASLNKAKFLARQETSIMMATFKEQRYRAAGSEAYVWTCVSGSSLHPVRPLHQTLNGKVFTWDSPPIVDENGNRKHPGTDYGCRCTARPIIKF